MEFLKEKAEKAISIGVLHIFGSSIANKVLSLLSNMIVIRLLSKAEYGYYAYAFNIISIVIIFSDLGTKEASLQYSCETEDSAQKNSILRFLGGIGCIASLIVGAVVYIYTDISTLSIPQGKPIIQALVLFPLANLMCGHAFNRLRIEKRNKQYAMLSFLQAAISMISSIIGVYLWKSWGMVASNYVSRLIPFLIGAIILRPYLKNTTEDGLGTFKKKEMLKYGILIMLTNSVTSVLQYLDSLLVGSIVRDEVVLADYKVALTIPTALLFIPTSCVVMVYPYFVSHKDDSTWIKNQFRVVQMFMGAISALIAIISFIFAEPIVSIIFGRDYLTAVPVFRVMSLNFFFSCTFRMLYGNTLAMLHLVKVNFVLGIVDCIVNILSDVVLIMNYGSIGAAYSTLFITVFSSVLSGVYFYWHLRKKG